MQIVAQGPSGDLYLPPDKKGYDYPSPPSPGSPSKPPPSLPSKPTSKDEVKLSFRKKI